MASDFATGTAITCSGNSALVTWTAAVEVTSIEFTDLWTREAVDFTHMESTTARAFRPTDLYDPGTLSVTVQYDSTLVMAPAPTETITWTITFPGGETFICNGFTTNFGKSLEVEGKMTQTITIKLTGAISGTIIS
jgi:hypothetical protein